MNMTQSRNTLTIEEARDILSVEHAARLFTAECWWSIVPRGENNPDSFAETGDSSGFWALVEATLSMGMPLGWVKGIDHLGRATNNPHSDPEVLLRQLIKPEVKKGKPDLSIITARTKYSGEDPDMVYKIRMAEYNAEIEADQKRIDTVVNIIMTQRHSFDTTEANPWDNLDDDAGRFHQGGEWHIPIDRIIDFGEKQLKFLATNNKVPDMIFGAEAVIWEGEINRLKQIVQSDSDNPDHHINEEIDSQLLSAAGMSAGGNAGK